MMKGCKIIHANSKASSSNPIKLFRHTTRNQFQNPRIHIRALRRSPFKVDEKSGHNLRVGVIPSYLVNFHTKRKKKNRNLIQRVSNLGPDERKFA